MDITDITRQVKEQLLEHKESRPMLFVEFSDGKIVMHYFADFPFDTLPQQKVALFEWGRTFGREHRDLEITQICFFIEAWGVRRDRGEPCKSVRPSLDPDRFEMLSVHILDIFPPTDENPKPSLKKTGRVIEILRSATGEIDLLPWKEEARMSGSPIEGFLAGFYSVKLSKKVWKEVKNTAMAQASSILGRPSVATKTKPKKKARKKH